MPGGVCGALFVSCLCSKRAISLVGLLASPEWRGSRSVKVPQRDAAKKGILLPAIARWLTLEAARWNLKTWCGSPLIRDLLQQSGLPLQRGLPELHGLSRTTTSWQRRVRCRRVATLTPSTSAIKDESIWSRIDIVRILTAIAKRCTWSSSRLFLRGMDRRASTNGFWV
jgi:hypothetical protein